MSIGRLLVEASILKVKQFAQAKPTLSLGGEISGSDIF